MRTTESLLSGRVEEIFVVEDPDGIFVAQCKGRPELKAEGATAEEAEDNLYNFLMMPYESGEVHGRQDIVADPDEVHGSSDD